VRLALAAALLAAALLPAPATAAANAVLRATPTPCHEGHVALTFDDGPSPAVTPRLVATLQRLHVPATFFMVGERVAASPATARLVERSGFLVGNHSYRHQDLQVLTQDEIEATIRATDQELRSAGVHPTHLMRPPYGAEDAHVLAAIHAEHDVPVLWDVDPRDWESGDAAQIASRVLGQLHPGTDIVLQHDGVGNSPHSVAAVPRIVREARRRGYCFVGLDERGRPGFPSPAATLSAAPADRHVAEGDTLRLTVTMAGEAGRDTSLRLVFRGRTASLDDDIRKPPTVVRFPAGTLSREVDVPIRADDLVEGKERFEIRVSDGVGLRPQRGRTTIVIDDAGH
jgi:peptidoglycan/xylan/chitin deacetylase (PgdA/CDA1 family)